MDSHQIKVQKTAHYYTLGTPGKEVQNFWIVCHGYGQLASKFIYKFEDISGPDTFILAPEGFSRFYFGGFNGKIGASWMTSQDRLIEIEDYCNYLQLLYENYKALLPSDVTINLLGFSQGGATHCRWLHARKPAFDNLILWACDYPDDLNYQELEAYMEGKKTFMVLGDQDEFLTPERLNKIRSRMDDQGVKREEIHFEGKHVVDRSVLKTLNERLINKETHGR